VADEACAWAVVLAAGAILVGYRVRRARRGALRFVRVEQAGQSALLGKEPMNAFYWALQPAAAACVSMRVSANAVTLASLGLAALAGALLSWGAVGGAALVSAIASLGDALDGLVARMTRTESDAGEVLDAAVDRYGELFFLGGAAVLMRRDPWALVATIGALGGGFMVSYASAKAEALRVAAPRGAMRRPERAAYLTAGATIASLVGAAWPLVAAISIVAVVANASAVLRLRRLAAMVSPTRAPAARGFHGGGP
jgi:CDP-diacylglycerol--glycerol-3-phosphate 3-phosphatidyltransferase